MIPWTVRCSWPEHANFFLCPTLSPGDSVIADNLASHKISGVSQAIAAEGASILYLPPYSPDLTPIEKMFAQTQGASMQSRQAHCRYALGAH